MYGRKNWKDHLKFEEDLSGSHRPGKLPIRALNAFRLGEVIQREVGNNLWGLSIPINLWPERAKRAKEIGLRLLSLIWHMRKHGAKEGLDVCIFLLVGPRVNL